MTQTTIIQDPDPESPRTWDNISTMVCAHRRYNLGDIHCDSPYAVAKRILDDLGVPLPHNDDADALIAKAYRHAVILPLYLYDHSGITISTTPFSCPWDSGQVGYVYCSKAKARAEFGRCYRKRALAAVVSEVATYDQYLRGDVWGYETTDDDGNVVDSCWGFYGSDPTKSGMQLHLSHHEIATAIRN